MAASGARNYTMAAEAAAEIVSQKLELLLSCREWVGCFPIETHVEDAKENLAKIRVFFSTPDRPSQSTEWTGRLLQALYDAEEFIDESHLKVARGRHEALHVATRPLTALVHKYMLRRDLSNLVKTLEDLCQDQYLADKKEAPGKGKKGLASSSSRASAPWEGQKLARLTNFWDQRASTNFVWHVAQKDKIMKQIRKDADSGSVHGISIWGEKGAGKTFLARCVYREAMYLGFDMQAWVRVSVSMDRPEFLFEILKQVDKLARGVMEFYQIKEMLNQKLANGKRFLIVLDNVHPSGEELCEELLTTIQPSISRGHIITTTQYETVAKSMSSGEARRVQLKSLDEDENPRTIAMKLHRIPHVPNQEPDKILNRVPALPLCISLFAGLLSCANEQERKALVNDDSKMSVSEVLELSYHKLPVHLKPCFIYMALFPVESTIPTRRLVRLWLAEGLLNSHCCDGERKTTPEEVGETFILELADRNVIDVVSWRADGSPKACQMRTSLYDLICPIVMSTGFLHIHNASKSKGTNDRNPTDQQQQLLDTPREKNKVRWLAEHTIIARDDRGNNYPDLNVGHIRSFLSFYLRRGMLTKDIGKFLGNVTSKADYNLLRVLDLEGVYKPSLQGVLRKLLLLRYLGLRSTVLDSIPHEVADLHYLETLDIKHTNITSLPSSLWKARNLRHLHLNWFYVDLKKILNACRNNAMALTQLQTLSGLVIGEVKENLMAEPMDSLTTLTTLKLFLQHSAGDTSSGVGKTVAHWISFRLANLQSLTFGMIQEAMPGKEAEPAEEDKPVEEVMIVAKPAKKATKVAQSLEEAQPSKENQATEEAQPVKSHIGLLPELSLAQHHELMELYLLGQLNKPIWTQLLPVSLRVLTLSGSTVTTDMMPELGGLLRNLRTLELLANSFLCESMSFVKDGFPSLKSLKIWKLPKLVTVNIKQGAMMHLKELEFRHLDMMKKVEGINECKELEYICVVAKKGARGLVDHLKDGKRDWTIVYER